MVAEAKEKIGTSIPRDDSGNVDINIGAFRTFGLDQKTALVAKNVYDGVMKGGESGFAPSPTEAWQTVWQVYLDGVSQGGAEAGLCALRTLEAELPIPSVPETGPSLAY